MQTIRKALLLVLVSLLLAAPSMAQTRTRIFAQNVEYTGPQRVVDGKLYVPVERFARTMGWAVKKQDAGICIAPTEAECSLPNSANGLYLKGQAFAGATQLQNDELYVSLPDLVSALGGSIKDVAEYHTAKLDVPGMPSREASASVHSLSDDLKGSQYTLVEYYATW